MAATEPEDARALARQFASEFSSRGDALGWFDALYREARGEADVLPWGDLAPNKFLKQWADSRGLRGNQRCALVVGCGLGDDARYLCDLGFDVTAFDISPTAIDWAKKLHADTSIKFAVADLFEPPVEWQAAFDFVLEVYTIQPLPIEMRGRTITAIASFVARAGTLLVVTRGRRDDEPLGELPWPLSRLDLSEFERSGLREVSFCEMPGDDDPPVPRFVIEYERQNVEHARVFG